MSSPRPSRSHGYGPRLVTAVALAIGIATPVACAKSVGDGFFEEEPGGAGGAGGDGQGGAGLDGPAPSAGPSTGTEISGPGPASASSGGMTSSTSSSTSASVAASTAASSTSNVVAASSTSNNVAASSSSGGSGVCCVPDPNPGCVDPFIEQCVCLFDDYCCTDAWDDYCVDEVNTFGCGSC